MKSIRVWLVRHLPPAVAPGICYGRSDLPLQTPLAQQADTVQALRDKLPKDVPVFSSPLVRCANLAAVLDAAYVQDSRLQELHFGAWEMQPWEDIGPHALDAWAKDVAGFRPPDGETGYEVQQRAWVREISNRHDEVIVVTHAGVIRALQAHYQALPGSEWLTLRYDYGQLVCLDFSIDQIDAAPVQ
ncbi:MAG: Alpha-ribazole-5'-phosphate phosphatase [Fluviibacter phosphoraccumulans EoVTN8]